MLLSFLLLCQCVLEDVMLYLKKNFYSKLKQKKRQEEDKNDIDEDYEHELAADASTLNELEISPFKVHHYQHLQK